MTDTIKAPACIFCGGETRMVHHFHAMRDFVECRSCVIRGPERPTRAEAVAAFLKPVADARRKALEEAIVAIKSRTHWQPAEGWADEEREGYANGWGDAETGFTEAVLWIMPAPDPAAPESGKEEYPLMPVSNPVGNPELEVLLERTRNYVMSDEEREAQRQSWARAMAPCEHGKADFEQCQECWNEHYARKDATDGD